MYIPIVFLYDLVKNYVSYSSCEPTRQQSNAEPQSAVEPQIYYGKPQSFIELKSCIRGFAHEDLGGG